MYSNHMMDGAGRVPAHSGATISPDGVYRYHLWRRWTDGPGRFATFIMLNPSTADAEVDDPTIRRCIGFAKAWGMSGMEVLNLYALRATDPKRLRQVPDPVGPGNDEWLRDRAGRASRNGWPLIAAWGVNAKSDRVRHVMSFPGMAALTALGTTKHGHPKHPLFLPRTSERTVWPPSPRCEGTVTNREATHQCQRTFRSLNGKPSAPCRSVKTSSPGSESSPR